jgi:hypothetical protein
MIAERLPELLSFSKEEKWQVFEELREELLADDPTLHEPFKSEIVAELEQRWQHYLAHPESAMTLDEARRRMLESRSK